MKRIISLIVSIIMIISLAESVFAVLPLSGDIDNDGSITVADALVVLRISAGLSSYKDEDIAIYDLNKDGSVSVDDALIVLRDATGLERIVQPLIPVTASIGDTVVFGKYEQNNNDTDGKEDIEWTVIAKSDDKILLMSKYALDAVPFNDTLSEMTWKKSSIRAWLNDGFINNTFSDKEMECILDTKTKSDYNPKYNSNTVTTTTDKVFLLNYTEAGKYFDTDESRKCNPTSYAASKGVITDSENNCAWWLRTLGYDSTYATAVNTKGELASFGYNVDEIYVGLRPVMWVSIGK